MSEQVTKQPDQGKNEPEKKSGFFGRMVQKLDSSMKQKAKEKSQQGGCCGGGDSKGGKCC